MYLSAYLLVRYRYRTTASLENEIRKPYFHANMATTIFFIAWKINNHLRRRPLLPFRWKNAPGCLIFEGIGEENRFLGLKVVFLYDEMGWLVSHAGEMMSKRHWMLAYEFSYGIVSRMQSASFRRVFGYNTHVRRDWEVTSLFCLYVMAFALCNTKTCST